MNDNTGAQLSQNKLESIVNQTNASTSPQINVGDAPMDLSYLGKAGIITDDFVYVANSLSDTVSVINPAIPTIKNIPVGDHPTFITTSGAFVYVANFQNDTVSIIDPVSNTVIKNITVGGSPTFIAPSGDSVYVAHYNNSISIIDLFSNTVIKNITVGDVPTFIAVSPVNPIELYVANTWNGTVSVIDNFSNTVIYNIPVGENPNFIEAFGDYIYVTNGGSNTVSVISPINNTVIKNIPVGDVPTFIAVSPSGEFYVANSGSNTVSVISPINNTVIKNIPVGDVPFRIAVSPSGDSVYVANHDSDTVSVIDPATNKVVAGVTFDNIPFRGGQISCNELNAPINRYFYVSSGTDCVAKPRSGYEFDSWVQIFDDNSTRTINVSTTSGSQWTPFLDIFGVKSNDPAATLTVNRFGNFTAYFKALPPPVSTEFTASIITVIVAAFVGSLLIPAVLSWFKSKKQTSRLNSFHLDMVSINKDGLDETDIKNLNELNQRISNFYAAGKITNEQYTNLKNDVSSTYQKIFKKRIESLTGSNTEAISKIKNDIKDAYSDRKITELDYNLLIEKISDMFNNK